MRCILIDVNNLPQESIKSTVLQHRKDLRENHLGTVMTGYPMMIMMFLFRRGAGIRGSSQRSIGGVHISVGGASRQDVRYGMFRYGMDLIKPIWDSAPSYSRYPDSESMADDFRRAL